MNLSELKTQFLEYIEIEKGRAVKTVSNYDHYLTTFLNQTKVKDPKEIIRSGPVPNSITVAITDKTIAPILEKYNLIRSTPEAIINDITLLR